MARAHAPAQPRTRLVLAGGGHAHLSVMQSLARRPADSLDVLLLTPSALTTYSGMLPGWMDGEYTLPEIQIDVGVLAAHAGIRVMWDSVAEIDAASATLTTRSGTRIPYDLLSLDIGGEVSTAPFASLGHRAVAVRPLDAFIDRWSAFVQQADRTRRADVVVVGGGAAGVELALAAQRALTQRGTAVTVALVSAPNTLLNGISRGAADRAMRCLKEQNIAVHSGFASADAQGIVLDSGARLPVDLAILATGSEPPAWLERTGLALANGGVAVGADLRSTSHPSVFAAGDIATRVDRTMPRSGVHAVRAGPVLATNLLSGPGDEPLRPYLPRRRTLYLLTTGERRAVLSWGTLSAEGAWVWLLKRAIDRRFVRRNTIGASSRSAE